MSSPRFGTSLLSLAALAATAVVAPACHKTQAATGPGPEVPAGQVWLTPTQVKDAKIEVAPIEEKDVDDTILTSGTVKLDELRTGHVLSPVTGRVVKIMAGLGAHVKKGESLAVIESPDIGNAESDLHKAEADSIAAEHDYRRKKTLVEQNAGSRADLEIALDVRNRAQAELERARQKVALLHAGNADMVSQTYTLTAPIEGEVLNRQISPGIEVVGQYSGGGASQELFTIGELGRVWVIGDVYEMDLARVHVGTPAQVTVVAYPSQVFKGSVDWVAGSLDANTRTASVRCTFDNAEGYLRPFMYATVKISVDQKRALAIPRDALLRLGDQKAVFVKLGEADGRVRFERVGVEVDEGESSPWLEVKKGLQPHQNIVVSGAILLSQML